MSPVSLVLLFLLFLAIQFYLGYKRLIGIGLVLPGLATLFILPLFWFVKGVSKGGPINYGEIFFFGLLPALFLLLFLFLGLGAQKLFVR